MIITIRRCRLHHPDNSIHILPTPILSEQRREKRKKEKKPHFLLLCNNFLKDINGQSVDSYSSFFHPLSREREGCMTCVSLTQNCSDVGARCVFVCDVLSASLYKCHQYVGRHGDSQTAKWA